MSKTTSDLYLTYKCVQGWNRKIQGKVSDEMIPTYAARLRKELDMFSQAGISDYFLILSDMMSYCYENDIPVGPARGSAAGCLVSYLTDITMVDPIVYGLLLERFYNPGRLETRQLPDIDADVSQLHRERIINEYIIPTYGADRVAPIIAFGTLGSKGAVKDVGRVLRVPIHATEAISALIDVKRGIATSIKEILSEKDGDTYSKHALKMREYMDEYPELFEIVTKIEDVELIRTTSVHAAGIVIAPEPVGNIVPVSWNVQKGLACTAYDMYNLESTGLLKLDLLGLRNTDVLYDTMQRLGEKRKYRDTLEAIPLDDAYVYERLGNGHSKGVFQFESSFMQNILMDIKPTSIIDLSTINALGRPGPLDAKIDVTEDVVFDEDGCLPPWLKKKCRGYKEGGRIVLNMIEVFAARKRGELVVTYMHPKLEPILSDTYGIMCYQEQIMRIATDLGGYTLAEADGLRKIMGKKLLDKIDAEQPKFVNGCMKNGIEEAVANDIWAQMKTFAAYGFNKCVHGSTLISLPDDGAQFPIEDLYFEGYRGPVISYDSRGKQVVQIVEDIMLTKVDETYQITLANNDSITVTDGHKFQTQRGILPLKDITENDFLLVPQNDRYNESFETHGDLTWMPIKSIKPMGLSETYDMTVSNTHNFLGNGILTQNSHSISYSILAYYTAYYKFRHPAEFMASLISSDDKIDQRKIWIEDARETCNLRISPPDINKASEKFNSVGSELFFGLAEIKGVGVKALAHILGERNKGLFKDIKDFYKRIDLGVIDAGVMNALVSSGAFSSFGVNRATIIAWDAEIRKRRSSNVGKVTRRNESIDKMERELESVRAGNGDVPKKHAKSMDPRASWILELENKIEKARIEALTFADKEHWFEGLEHVKEIEHSLLLSMEEQVLGVAVSGNVADPYRAIIRMHGHDTSQDIKEDVEKKFFTMCGVLTDVRQHVVKAGKNKGATMAFAKLNDLKGGVNVTIFPRQYDLYKNIIYDNKLVQAKVVRMDDKTDTVSVNSLNDIGAVYAS